ncbi:T9SS type A sorting domain-containing protein [Bacteroidota bacterium]
MRSFLVILLALLSGCLNWSYAQIMYSDINPDTILIGSQSATYLDINGDAINDYALFHDTVFTAWPNDSGQVNGVAHFNGNELLCVIDGHMYPRALIYNYFIDQGAQDWVNYENNVPLFVYAMVAGEYQNWGYFQNMTIDKYIGIRFNLTGAMHYGWIRIFIQPDGTYMVVKDFAYNSIPNEGIFIGEGIPTPAVKNVMIEDLDDLGDGRDLNISFTKAEDEFLIFQYRLFVVKAEDTTLFDCDQALKVLPGNSLPISPDGKDHVLILKESSKDVDGDLIIEDQEYVVCIVSYPKGTNSDDYIMAKSNSLKLTNSSGISESGDRNTYFKYNNGNLILYGNERGVDFKLFDLSGRVVKNYQNVSGTVSISGLQKGIYVLSVSDEGYVLNKKLVVTD